MRTLLASLGVFTAAMAALGGGLAYPAGLWGGDQGRMSLLAALILSTIPGWLTLLAHSLARTPQQKVLVGLASTTGRLLFVGAGALVLINMGQLPQQQIAVWLIVCYFAALFVETGLVLRGSKSAGESALSGFAPLFNLGGR